MKPPIKINLPWWMSGPELSKLKAAAQNWLDYLLTIAQWPLGQLDAREADEGIVRLIAWQRGIDRFNGESLEMFRLRVFHAYANAKDAGSVIGFTQIFKRLNLGYLEQVERQPDKDWDVIILNVSDSTTSQNPEFMNWLIQTYGRTCRRYEWNVITVLTLSVKSAAFDWDQSTSIAAINGEGKTHG